MFEWKDSYNTGIQFIDEQHKKLFFIAENIYKLLQDKDIFDKYDKIIVLIDELKDYTAFHFKNEEDYMQSIKYKKFFTQKVQHDFFIEKLNNIDIYSIDDDQDEYLRKMLADVSSWIIDHILERDTDIPKV